MSCFQVKYRSTFKGITAIDVMCGLWNKESKRFHVRREKKEKNPISTKARARAQRWRGWEKLFFPLQKKVRACNPSNSQPEIVGLRVRSHFLWSDIPIRWTWRDCVGLLKQGQNSTRDSLYDAHDSQTSVFPPSSTQGLISNHSTCRWSSIVLTRGTRPAVWVSSEVRLQLQSFPHSRARSLICISHLKLRWWSRPFVPAILLTVRIQRH